MLVAILEKTANRGPIVMQISHLLGKFSDKAADPPDHAHVRRPLTRSPSRITPWAWRRFLAGQADVASTEADAGARDEARLGARRDPEGRSWRQVSPPTSSPSTNRSSPRIPARSKCALQLGRELAAERRLAEARDQFPRPTSSRRATRRPLMRWALLSLQLEDFGDRRSLQPRAEAGLSRATASLLGMGQAAEGTQEIRRAIGWYQKVEAGDWVRAQLKDSRPSSPASKGSPRAA